MVKLVFFFFLFLLLFTCRSNIKPTSKVSTTGFENKKNEQKYSKKYSITIPQFNFYHSTAKINKIPMPQTLSVVRIMATGDIIPHGAVKQTAMLKLNGKTVSPNFSYLFKEVKKTIKDSDISFANLETPYKPGPVKEVYKSIPYKFNIPQKMLKELKNIGFTVFSIANNHLYDQGKHGIVTTIDILDKLKIKHIGAGKTYSEGIKPVIINKKGLKIGFLAFTTWINNDKNEYIEGDKNKQNKNSPYLNRFYDSVALKSIKRLKKITDFLIVSMHWGHEYHKNPSYEQKRKAKLLIKAGADLILGHHPHVLQPIVYKKGSWIVYSMGNFISNQFFEVKNRHSKSKDSNREGIIYEINLIKKNGKTEIKEIILHPLYLKREFLKNNPDKLKEPYKIYISALKPHEKKYKDIIKFIGPPKIYPEYLKNLSEKIIKYILVLQRKYYVGQR